MLSIMPSSLSRVDLVSSFANTREAEPRPNGRGRNCNRWFFSSCMYTSSISDVSSHWNTEAIPDSDGTHSGVFWMRDVNIGMSSISKLLSYHWTNVFRRCRLSSATGIYDPLFMLYAVELDYPLLRLLLKAVLPFLLRCPSEEWTVSVFGESMSFSPYLGPLGESTTLSLVMFMPISDDVFQLAGPAESWTARSLLCVWMPCSKLSCELRYAHVVLVHTYVELGLPLPRPSVRQRFSGRFSFSDVTGVKIVLRDVGCCSSDSEALRKPWTSLSEQQGNGENDA